MATVRKKGSGFSDFTERSPEEVSIDEFLEGSNQELLEATLQTESALKEESEVSSQKPFIPLEITPTGDEGPRFTDKPIPAPVRSTGAAPQLQPPPKRHPRNIPKFSRFK